MTLVYVAKYDFPCCNSVDHPNISAFMPIPKYKLHACIQSIMTIEKKKIMFVCQFKSNRYKIYQHFRIQVLIELCWSSIYILPGLQNGKHVLMYTFLSQKCYQPFLNIQRYYLSSSLFICVFCFEHLHRLFIQKLETWKNRFFVIPLLAFL